MKVRVINSQVYGNPYQQLLYRAIASRYQLASGSPNKAITLQLLAARSIYHIHWEEALFIGCETSAQAIKVKDEYVRRLKHYVSLGGKVVWTLHNITPHERRFIKVFLSLRAELAVLSHRILVHNRAALSTLENQTKLTDLSKVSVLQHPAYFDCYESAEQTKALAGRMPGNPRTLLYFGLVRAYKGIPELISKLPEDFMSQHQLALHICGEPIRADSFLDDLLTETKHRSDITYSLSTVANEHVADLLRSNAGVIIPYHKVLTSGVAVLSLTLGVPVIAPNTPAMKELFPESSHHLLFNPRSAKDLRRAVLALVNMSEDVRKKIAQDYIEQAITFNPQAVSIALGAIYDEILGLTRAGEAASTLTPMTREPGNLARLARTPSLLQFISEDGIMATRTPKTAATALTNQQLALELVKATLLGSVRTGVSDELILNAAKDAGKLTLERARLDGAYAVRLYTNILTRLDNQSSVAQSGSK